MVSYLIRLIVVAALSLAAMTAHAITYNVHERYTGTFTETDLGGGNYSSTYNLKFDSLLAGDASLFSNSQSFAFDGGKYYICLLYTSRCV